ncbi:MAG: efflux RND transporter periplasmic adaptor subunit, partial [Chlorobiales bacterium]|nr:efflux RND transporter periplasmic adaptor subunit [Chlorobiales bacterium]
ILVQPNSIVQSGQVLALLESSEIGNLTAEIVQRYSEFAVTEADYQRKKELAGENIIPKKSLFEAERTFRTATAMLQAVESRAAAAGFSRSDIQRIKSNPDSAVTSVPIRATISGAVASSEATLGKYVEPQTTLFRIVNLSKVLVVGRIFEPDFGKLQAGQPVEINAGAYPNEHFSGTLQSVGIAVDEETHTLPIRVILDNPGHKLKPEMHVELKISTETPGDVLVIPNNAIGIDGTEKFVFVQKSDSLFERRAVQVSQQTKETAAITKGVSKGEKVASKGMFFLKSMLKSSELED